MLQYIGAAIDDRFQQPCEHTHPILAVVGLDPSATPSKVGNAKKRTVTKSLRR